MRKLFVVLTAVVSLLAAAPAWAHHAFAAEFDADKPIKFKGTVTKMEWINPHAWIHIDVTGDDGKVTPWMIEAAAPNALLRGGSGRLSLAALLFSSFLPGPPRSQTRPTIKAGV